MSEQQAARARASYNRMSGFYGLLSSSSEKKLVEVAIGQLLRPKPGEHILEPGFGAGQALVALAGLVGETGRVSGLEASDGMIDVTRKRLIKAGVEGRAELTQGDAADMPYEDSTFDAVFMSFTLELFSDELIPVVLAECARVLKEDGRLCVASMSDRGKSGAMLKLYVSAHRRFPSFVDCRPIDARGKIEAAGFDVVEEKILSMWGLPVEIALALPTGTGDSTT